MIPGDTVSITLSPKYMDVSENSGTPKSSILIGFSIINHPFWGIPIFGNTHMLAGKRLRIIHTFYCCPVRCYYWGMRTYILAIQCFVSSAPLFISSSHVAVLSQTIIGLKFHRECLICWYDKGDVEYTLED